jgi:hypothetical protein
MRDASTGIRTWAYPADSKMREVGLSPTAFRFTLRLTGHNAAELQPNPEMNFLP